MFKASGLDEVNLGVNPGVQHLESKQKRGQGRRQRGFSGVEGKPAKYDALEL